MEINLLPSCVVINGSQITSTPTVEQFLYAVDERRSGCRFFGNPSGNTLGVLDDLGLNFLYADATEFLHLFMIKLEWSDWRRITDRDPKSLYGGTFRVGGRPVPLPMTISMAELIRRKRFDAFNLMFTPNERAIASLTVSFDERSSKQFEVT